ncbi:hypothetical protein BT63DRAFT_415757 [Microthyrium microscopicum]|uniref:Uncharacterized protein n=1 Tax=Microthyrium microscopicum TaxID=703497 RepID=A0A6A6U6A6_9PEZI|nr:hypothetical protein BT63DRAFT_415757 [Microthyrium microscopicum]
MPLEECTCTSVDSPLSIAVAALDIITFAIAVTGLILAGIAIFRSYRSAHEDANRFEAVYNAANDEVKLLRWAYGLVPELFEPRTQTGGLPEGARGADEPISTLASEQHGVHLHELDRVHTAGGTGGREVRKRQLEKAATDLIVILDNAAIDVNTEKNKLRDSGFSWLRKKDGLLNMMKERSALTPSVVLMRLELMGLLGVHLQEEEEEEVIG